MISFVSNFIKHIILDCPERPDSKSRIAAVSDKDKALPWRVACSGYFAGRVGVRYMVIQY